MTLSGLEMVIWWPSMIGMLLGLQTLSSVVGPSGVGESATGMPAPSSTAATKSRSGNAPDRVDQGRELGTGGEALEADSPGFGIRADRDGGDFVDPIGTSAVGLAAGVDDVKHHLLRRRVF